MAIARDASSPASVYMTGNNTGDDTGTTASFVPPVGAVVVAYMTANTAPAATPTYSVSNTGGGLSSWTTVASATNSGGGGAAIFYATVTSSVATTVSVVAAATGYTRTTQSAPLFVDVWTGVRSLSGAASASGTFEAAALNPSLTTTKNRSRVVGVFADWQTLTLSSSDTYTYSGPPGSGTSGMRVYKASDTASASTSVSLNFAASGTALGAYVLLELLDSLETEQEAFRFGVDDGSESAHTWEAAQDTNITLPDTQSRLVRVLVSAAAGDPASAAYTLRYQKNGSGGYTALPVGATTSPTIGTPTIGTVDFATLNGSSVAPSYPASIAADDTLVLIVGQKPSSANSGTVTTPSGWTLRASRTGATDGNTGGYTTTLAADQGNTNIFVYTKDSVAGTESGTLSVTLGTSNTCWAGIIRIPKTGSGTWSFAANTGKDTTAGDVSIASSAGMDIAAGDMLIGAMVIPTDVTTPAQFSAETFAQTGTTFGTAGELNEPDTSVGDDIGGFIFYQSASSGSGSGTVTMTATAGGTNTNVRGPGIILRARLTGLSNEVYVATSSNIASGGEATTARLTAPPGKTTSDFVTGRRWDDENGTDTLDITLDDYTEVEWLVALSSAPSNGDYYDFRVYAGSTALDTYTQTPRWTVGTAGPTTSFVYLRSIAPLLLH